MPISTSTPLDLLIGHLDALLVVLGYYRYIPVRDTLIRTKEQGLSKNSRGLPFLQPVSNEIAPELHFTFYTLYLPHQIPNALANLL